MDNRQKSFVGIDLFSGAGGLSLGAEMAGIDVAIAIEKDKFAARTYGLNHPQTIVINTDITNIEELSLSEEYFGREIILFGGPPCQGFSTSNRRTGNRENPQNWLYKEFIRVLKLLSPDWVLFENVTGIVEFESGSFLNTILKDFLEAGYDCSYNILTASDYGIPQRRSRFFLIGSKKKGMKSITIPKSLDIVTVEDAIADLPELANGASIDVLPYKKRPISKYANCLRGELEKSSGHLVSKNSGTVVRRYEFIGQGENWESIPRELMSNYSDCSRCHTGIYHRLHPEKPSVVIGNYRKNMLIHPWSDRGLSVREAARLQSFPDNYVFTGSIGFQQQQVGNAVPPLLAKKVFELITEGV